jgi:hypothetical protein
MEQRVVPHTPVDRYRRERERERRFPFAPLPVRYVIDPWIATVNQG